MAGALFVACLDVPSDPQTSSKISDVTIISSQNGITDTALLKVNSTDSSSLEAEVHPSTYKNDVTYYWYNNEDILDSGRRYTISPTTAQSGKLTKMLVPNRLVIKDKEDNSIEKLFKVIVNSSPSLSDTTKPADGDTLYVDRQATILFQWESYDRDQDQNLEHVLEIDSIRYAVGSFLQLKQSGFAPGAHSFRVIVADPYGDMDSTSLRSFFVVDSTGGPLD